jgi:hypothetical protein
MNSLRGQGWCVLPAPAFWWADHQSSAAVAMDGMLNRALASFGNDNTANSIDMSMDTRAICGVERGHSPKSGNVHRLVQRTAVWLDADERERAMQDSDTALAREPRQTAALVHRTVEQVRNEKLMMTLRTVTQLW